MSIFGWGSKRRPQEPEIKQAAPTLNKRPKIDPEVAKERARKNSPWRFDDGPSRRPVGSK